MSKSQLEGYFSAGIGQYQALLEGEWSDYEETDVTSSWYFVDSYMSLEQAISVDSSVQYQGVSSSSEFSSEIVNEVKIEENNVLFVVVSKKTQQKKISGISLIDGGDLPYPAVSPGSFISNYGDLFEKKRYYGAIYVAVYRFYSRTSTEATSVKAMLQGASGPFSASVAADFKTAVSNIDVQCSCSTHARGFSPSSQGRDIDTILNICDEVSKLDVLDAVLLRELQPYSPTYVSGLSDVDPNTKYFTDKKFSFDIGSVTNADYTIKEIYPILEGLRSIANNINRIYNSYGLSYNENVKKLSNYCSSGLRDLDEQKSRFTMDPTVKLTLPTDVTNAIELGTPRILVTLENTQTYGGDGVNPNWPFLSVRHSDLEAWVEDEKSISSVTIGMSRGGIRIQSVSIVTENRNGKDESWCSSPPNWVAPYPATTNVKWQANQIKFIDFKMATPTSLIGMEIVTDDSKTPGKYSTVLESDHILLGFSGFLGGLGGTGLVCAIGAQVAKLDVTWSYNPYYG